MATIDLNCDLGEGYGPYSFGTELEILPYVSSVNIACGFHAGDPRVMEKTVAAAAAADVAVGAHPGFPDRVGFGRRAMAVDAHTVYTDTLYQIGALQAFVKARGVSLHHVKPHGALYHALAKEPELAEGFVRAVAALDPSLIIVGPPGSELISSAMRHRLPSACEGFADRVYGPDGNLLSRARGGGLHDSTDAVVAQALAFACGQPFSSVDGVPLHLSVHTLCVHGDTPNAVAMAQRVRTALEHAGFCIQPCHQA